MAYIEPNTLIKLYRGINIDKNYENTLYFANINAQELFFHVNNTNLKWTLERQSFQRVSKGTLRIEKPVHNLYDCNYMAFQNSAFGTKWFYAFITNVEYVNNITSEITYEIDVIQSYIHDVTIPPCFIEREHSATDNVGDNLLDENLETGEYQFGYIQPSGKFGDWGVLVQSPYDKDITAVRGRKYSNIINGNYIIYFESNDWTSFVSWLDRMNSSDTPYADSIATVSMYPNSFRDTRYAEFIPVEHQTFDRAKPTKVGSYTPRNKKLLTYPYNYLGVFTGDGTMGTFRYEFFDDDRCNFRITADPNTVTFMLVPINYNTSAPNEVKPVYNYNESLTMDNVPLCSFQGDTWKIWYGQNKTSLNLGLTMGALSGLGAVVTGAVTANPIVAAGGAITAISSITNSVGKIMDHQAIPNYVKGTAGSGIGITDGFQDFNTVQVSIHEEFARTIDSYFDMFGYATKEIKEPNRHVRKEWTYTKTIGCIAKCDSNISLGCSAKVLEKIESIFDNGIRFWVNNENVGEYRNIDGSYKDNSPL